MATKKFSKKVKLGNFSKDSEKFSKWGKSKTGKMHHCLWGMDASDNRGIREGTNGDRETMQIKERIPRNLSAVHFKGADSAYYLLKGKGPRFRYSTLTINHLHPIHRCVRLLFAY